MLAADVQGRAHVAALSKSFGPQTASLARLNSAGAIEFTTPVAGEPLSIAIDPSGAVLVGGGEYDGDHVFTGFLQRFAPDGSPVFHSFLPFGIVESVASDANGNIAVFGAGLLRWIDANGAIVRSATVGPITGSRFALDPDGNAFVTVVTNRLYKVRNSLASCGFGHAANYSQLLSVIAPDGAILQSTYLPGADTPGRCSSSSRYRPEAYTLARRSRRPEL